MTDLEHPFAQYIRCLGRGKRGSRSLTAQEAQEAMQQILQGNVAPEQLGAFLMLLRVKEEAAEEVAGFVRAARRAMVIPASAVADLDWSSYAGKRRHLPWYLLAALLLAENGVRILMHGSAGHSASRVYTQVALAGLGVAVATSADEAARQIARCNFAYLPLGVFAPTLQRIIELRPLLGLRSPVHTVVRLLNPFAANAQLQGVFHPPYLALHRDAGVLLGQPRQCVIRGEGGEIERNPDSECDAYYLLDGQAFEERWPALFQRRHVKDETLSLPRLSGVWRGADSDEYAHAAIIGTAALALRTLGRAATPEDAIAQADEMWQRRERSRF